jgi:hypothetical protein
VGGRACCSAVLYRGACKGGIIAAANFYVEPGCRDAGDLVVFEELEELGKRGETLLLEPGYTCSLLLEARSS